MTGGGAGIVLEGELLFGRPGAADGGVTGVWRAGGGVLPGRLGGVAVGTDGVVLAGVLTVGGFGTPLEGAPLLVLLVS